MYRIFTINKESLQNVFDALMFLNAIHYCLIFYAIVYQFNQLHLSYFKHVLVHMQRIAVVSGLFSSLEKKKNLL